jgi:phosphoglycerate dehydrogenase-like enzyme
MVAGAFAAPWAQWLGDNTQSDWKILSWKEGGSFDEFAAGVVNADAVVAGNIRGDWPAVPRLRLYHVPFTGYEWLDAAKLPGSCIVCNCYEHEIAISEYVMGVILERQIGFRDDDVYFREHGWKDRPPGGGPAHGELYEKTIGIIGYGAIGREVAVRAAAFGMRVVGISRTAPKTVVPLAWFDDMAALPRLLRESDFVLMALPLSDETKGMFDAQCFASMKADALFINVGRGMTVDEEALYNALSDRRIGGAVIDVWYRYPGRKDPLPAPSRFPFQDLDNVLMTPHNSARTQETSDRRWKSVAANLDRLARGEPLKNIRFRGTG